MKYLSIIVLGTTFVFMVWLFGVRGVQVLARQHEAELFPSTQGEVLSSQVTTTTGSKGSIHYHVSITYRYFVDGQTYVSRRYRYDGHPGNRNVVNAVVAAHPAGSRVEVYYNPQNLRDALLSPAVDAQDFYQLFLMTPINLVFLYALVSVARQMEWPGRSTPVAGGVKLISEMMVTRARLPQYQPLTLGLVSLGALSLLAGILMATGVMSHPPLERGVQLLAFVLLGSGLVYGWHRRTVRSGRQDLVIDEGAQTIQLPLTYKRREQRPVPFSEIEAVALKKVRHRSKRGVYYTYLVTLEMKDGSIQNLVNLNQGRAEAFAAWLKERFGLVRTTTTSAEFH